MLEAIRFCTNRNPLNLDYSNGLNRYEIDCDYAVINFDDGTAIACRSEWTGPYSDVTPDIDCADPIFQIYS